MYNINTETVWMVVWKNWKTIWIGCKIQHKTQLDYFLLIRYEVTSRTLIRFYISGNFFHFFNYLHSRYLTNEKRKWWKKIMDNMRQVENKTVILPNEINVWKQAKTFQWEQGIAIRRGKEFATKFEWLDYKRSC
jgi:hypothetical protein